MVYIDFSSPTHYKGYAEMASVPEQKSTISNRATTAPGRQRTSAEVNRVRAKKKADKENAVMAQRLRGVTSFFEAERRPFSQVGSKRGGNNNNIPTLPLMGHTASSKNKMSPRKLLTTEARPERRASTSIPGSRKSTMADLIRENDYTMNAVNQMRASTASPGFRVRSPSKSMRTLLSTDKAPTVVSNKSNKKKKSKRKSKEGFDLTRGGSGTNGFGWKFGNDKGLTMEQQWKQFTSGGNIDKRYKKFENKWKEQEFNFKANPELACAKAAYMAESHRYGADEITEALIGAKPTHGGLANAFNPDALTRMRAHTNVLPSNLYDLY